MRPKMDPSWKIPNWSSKTKLKSKKTSPKQQQLDHKTHVYVNLAIRHLHISQTTRASFIIGDFNFNGVGKQKIIILLVWYSNISVWTTLFWYFTQGNYAEDYIVTIIISKMIKTKMDFIKMFVKCTPMLGGGKRTAAFTVSSITG